MTKQEIIEGLNCCQDVARSGLWACSCIQCPYRNYKNENDPNERCEEKLLKDAEKALKGEYKTMKESMMNKAKKFWAAHKYKIIGVVAVLGCAGYAYAKYHNCQFSDEEIEKNGRLAEPVNDSKSENTETEFDRRQKAPAYQLANGGWITDDFEIGPFTSDDGKEINCVEMIINDLPIGNLGVFADDISKKLDEMYPNHGPLTDVSMIIDLRSDPTFEGESHQDIRKEESAA